MKSVCMIFEIHEPLMLQWYWPRDGYRSHEPDELYFDHKRHRHSFERHLSLSYIPANRLLLKLIEEDDAKFSFRMDGSFLNLCREYIKALDSFRGLVRTGNIELLGSPYYNTLSCFFNSMDEFTWEVRSHKEALHRTFGYAPSTFANTELIFNEEINRSIMPLGFRRAIVQGSRLDTRLGYRTGTGLIAMPVQPSLSADIGSRFSNRSWTEYPLTADKYASWIAGISGEVTVIYVSYLSFGYRHRADTGIFDFLAALPGALNERGISMITPSEYSGVELEYAEFHDTISRGPIEDILGNHMQHLYYNEIKRMEKQVKRCQSMFIDLWQRLQTTDILSDMAVTRPWYPWDKTVSNMLLLSDFKRRLIEAMQ